MPRRPFPLTEEQADILGELAERGHTASEISQIFKLQCGIQIPPRTVARRCSELRIQRRTRHFTAALNEGVSTHLQGWHEAVRIYRFLERVDLSAVWRQHNEAHIRSLVDEFFKSPSLDVAEALRQRFTDHMLVCQFRRSAVLESQGTSTRRV